MDLDVPLSPILVADDNPTDVFFLRRRLVTAGILSPVEHVEDGMEAVRWLERCLARVSEGAVLPWLVFIDLKMPRMDGFELLRWIHEHGICDRTTISILSTSDEPVDIERATRLGTHRFLVKYPQPAELVELAAFARTRSHSPFGGGPGGPSTQGVMPA